METAINSLDTGQKPNLEQQTATIFSSLIDLLTIEYRQGHLSIYRMSPLISRVLGSRIAIGNASRYIYAFAKSLGYDIPPYPLAGSGEIKQFFADEGVKNVPEWYRKIGLTDQEYEHLHEYTIVAVRGLASDRTALLIPLYMKNWPAFCGLEESGISSVLPGPAFTELLVAILECAFDDSNSPGRNSTVHIRRFALPQLEKGVYDYKPAINKTSESAL